MKPRVLVIAYWFPPIADAGAQRPFKFAKYLPANGWAPTVLTAAHAGDHRVDPALVAEVPASVAVIRVPMLNERIGRIAASLALGTPAGDRIASGVSWRLGEHFHRPDRFALWRPTARRAALRIFEQSGFDAVYATGFPWTSLLVGCDIAKVTGRPLVADFRGPWASGNLLTPDRVSHHEALAMEREVVTHAARVLTVSRALTRRLRSAYPEVDAEKFVTVPHGFDPADLIAPAPAPHATFRMVLIGDHDHGGRALYDVIEWINRGSPRLLDGVEIIAAGFAPGEARRRRLDPHIREVGVLPHRDAVSLMHSADMLFFGNGEGSRRQIGLPARLFESLASGRPVLALTHPDGDIGQLIKAVGGGLVVGAEDPGDLLNAVVTALRTRALEVPPVDRLALAAFERASLTARLAALLTEATQDSVGRHISSVTIPRFSHAADFQR